MREGGRAPLLGRGVQALCHGVGLGGGVVMTDCS